MPRSSFPCLFGFPCFLDVQGIPCFFERFFPFFLKDFRGSARIKDPWWFSLPFSKKARKRRSGWGLLSLTHLESKTREGCDGVFLTQASANRRREQCLPRCRPNDRGRFVFPRAWKHMSNGILIEQGKKTSRHHFCLKHYNHQRRNHPHHHFGQLTRTMVWVLSGRRLGPWSEFPCLYRFTVLLNSGGSNSPWSEFWSEFPHCMGMGVVPAPSTIKRDARLKSEIG